jgi:hypothetical protein
VLFVHGEGGIGKTSLLLELRARAQAAGRTVVLVDGRDIDASPAGFESALAAALGRGAEARDGEGRRCPPGRPAGRRLRAAEPAGGLAARRLSSRLWTPRMSWCWRAATGGRRLARRPGWRHVVAVHRLEPLDPDDSGQLLALAGVAESDRTHLVELGRGYPLALALLADVARAGVAPATLADVPALVSILLDSLLRGAPTQAHVSGLATCAKAWLTTEDLLRDVVGPRAPAVWAWLERRPVRRPGAVRARAARPRPDVLDAEFERRSPERYRALQRVIHDHTVECLRAATGADRQLRARQLMHLHRKAPFTAAANALRAQGSTALVPGRPEDTEEVLSLLERFEGPESVRLAAAWLAELPDGLIVVRVDGAIGGFGYHLTHPTGSALEHRDPAIRAVLDHVQREGPLRPGRADTHRTLPQAGGTSTSATCTRFSSARCRPWSEWVTRPLAWSFVIVVDSAYWGPIFDYLGFGRLVEVDVGGLPHVAYGVDWRRFPVQTWLDLHERAGALGRHRATAGRPAAPPPLDRGASVPPSGPPWPTCTGRTGSPPTPLVASSLGDGGSLRATIEAAIGALAGEPQGWATERRAGSTYRRAAPTQEAAAEVLWPAVQHLPVGIWPRRSIR